MKADEKSIENNVKLIAILGVFSFATLIGALFVVQQSFVSSQAKFVETIVPIQQQLARIEGAQGSMFLRQGAIIAATPETLESLADREHHEDGMRAGVNGFQALVRSTGLFKQNGFPQAAAGSMTRHMEHFLKADDELYDAALSYQNLKKEIQSSVDLIEKDLRRVIEESGGLAGVLRLEHVLHLRRLSKELVGAQVESALLRPIIYGNSRLQLDTISQLDAALLRLGVLAGKIGMAASEDSLNSLAANELVQNREQILHVLGLLEHLVKDEGLAMRLRSLRTSATELASRVGDESLSTSLASLQRRMFQEKQLVRNSQHGSADVAKRLDLNTSELRHFLQDVSNQAQVSASLTIRRSQQVVLTITMGTIVFTVIAAFRVRASVLALRLQNQRLSCLSDELTQSNQSLERTIADRTASLQTVLDSSGDGLLSVDLYGVLLPERSKVVTTWFGESQPGDKLWNYIASDTATRERMAMAIEQMAEEKLPFEVSADQAPKTIGRDDRTYEIDYREIRELGKLTRILVLLRDVTSEIVAKRAESEMREMHMVIGNVLKNRNGFDQTLENCAQLISEISQSIGTAITKRNLHTLKGNCATVGFQRVADHIHSLESLLLEEQREPTTDEIVDLDRCWQTSLKTISEYLDPTRTTGIELADSELSTIKAMVEGRAKHEEIAQLIDSWRNERTAAPLSRLAEQARQVAKRVGKKISITVKDNCIRVPPDRLRRFWSSMIHVVQNAVDHGIEEPQQRESLGKDSIAKLTLTTRIVDGNLEVEVSDDGSGIDWQRVQQVAERRGLPVATQANLIDALFSDGISTREIVSDVSGRGVGLSAVRSECRKAGGEIQIKTIRGLGTTFLFRFSAACLADVYQANDLQLESKDSVTYV